MRDRRWVLVLHVSRFTLHASRFTLHASRFTSHFFKGGSISTISARGWFDGLKRVLRRPKRTWAPVRPNMLLIKRSEAMRRKAAGRLVWGTENSFRRWPRGHSSRRI